MTDAQSTPEKQPGIWCVVANVAPLQMHGEAHEIRLGTKHFSPNTKVYCFPPQWGDGYEKIKVAGRHRGARGLSIMVIARKRLTHWRVKFVYDPFVVRNVHEWHKENAEAMVAAILFDLEVEAAQIAGFESVSADNALIYALRLRSLDEARKAIERGANVNTRRADGWTALGMAILYGGIAGVQLMLDRGARADTVGVYATTSVLAAPSLYAPEVVRLVKEAAGSIPK
jgi:hypothetical protein